MPRDLVAVSLSASVLALVVVLGGAQAQTGPPSVDGEGAREVTDTTALLAGYVNPNGGHTTYRFEYGLDTSYGSTTAVDNAGSGATAVPATKSVSGLQPNTTYHFRLVASNAAGETQGADQTFTTSANPPEPSGRVYEMVSPLDKNGGDIDRDRVLLTSSQRLTNQSGAAASGDAAAFTSRLQFAGIESGAIEPTYVARRGPSGWTTEGVTPPIGNVQPTGTERPSVAGLSPDLSKAFVKTPPELTPDAALLNGSEGLYMRSSGQSNRYTLLSSPFLPPTDPLPPEPNRTAASLRFEYSASTPDSRHVVFNSSRHLLSGPGIPGDSPTAAVPNAVYEWVDGTLRLVSFPPDGITFGSGNVVAGAVLHRGGFLPGANLLSDDGRRVFFSAPVEGAGRHVFMREDGNTTVHVSRSEIPPGGVVPSGNADFWAARSADGSVVFFKAEAPLTPDAGAGALVYRRDFNAPPGQPPLTVISKDKDQDANPPQQAAVEGPAAVNDAATSVAFVARGLLDSDEDDVMRGARNLYLWRQGKGVEYVATLDASRDTPVASQTFQPVGNGGPAARISADGERLLFASFAQLDDYDILESHPGACGNPNTGGDPCRQIYLYDARSDDLSCLTCIPAVPITGNANLFGNSEAGRLGDPTINAPFRLPRNLSADGTRAFFETARPLVSADQNTKIDVYEWEDRNLDGEGELRMISSGRSTSDSKFLDASVSGDDVFFTTRDQLVGIDTDNLVDLYDARVGGGIPAQNPPPASVCEGEECQGVFSGPPFLPALGSGGASHGNLRPGRRPSFSLARLSPRQRAQLARGRAVMVRVRVNRAGRVSLTARARVGGRMRTVAGAARRARRAGAVRLKLQLSRPALRALARRRTLNVTVAVRFTGVREARTSMLRLRRVRPSEETGAR
jgi:hypothetical protein